MIKALANLRESPSDQSIVLKTLPAGIKVKVIEKTGEWYYVLCYDGVKAYIRESLLQVPAPVRTTEPARTLRPVNKTKVKFPNPITYLTLKDANMRFGPGKKYAPPIALIQADTEFVTNGRTGKWYHGKAGNKTGWIYADLLNIESNSPGPEKTAEPAAGVSTSQQNGEPEPTQASPPTQASEPDSDLAVSPETTESDQTPAAHENVTNEKATEPNKIEAPKTLPPPSSGISPGKAKISSYSPVKVRAQMSQLSKVVEELAPGSEVTVLENTGSWYKIQTSQRTGFIPSGTLTSGGN